VRIAKDLLSTDRQWFNQPVLDRFPTQLPVVIATLMAPLASSSSCFCSSGTISIFNQGGGF